MSLENPLQCLPSCLLLSICLPVLVTIPNYLCDTLIALSAPGFRGCPLTSRRPEALLCSTQGSLVKGQSLNAAFQAAPKGWQPCSSPGPPLWPGEGCFSPDFLKDAHHFQPTLLCSVAVARSMICGAFSEPLKLSAWSPGHKRPFPITATTCSFLLTSFLLFLHFPWRDIQCA